MKPYEAVVIQHVNDAGAPSNTVVIKIPSTISEHNMMIELLKHLRVNHPGPWYCVQQWERQQYLGPITIPAPKPAKIEEPFQGIKEVSREHLGLPADDELGDVPV